jgi:ribonuclease P protein subunit POP4
MLGEITDKNIIQHEFIGLKTTIIDSPCKTIVKLTGRIVDETMNTFMLEYLADGTKKVITIPKHKTRFRFTIPVNRSNSMESEITIEIDGSILMKRPEDRIKKLSKLANKMKDKNQRFLRMNNNNY